MSAGAIIEKLDAGTRRKGWALMGPIAMTILAHQTGPIVDIGAGSSTLFLALIAQRFKVKLYTCDIKMGGMWELFDKPLFPDHTIYIGKSEDFIKEFDDEPMIVYIDGQHDYEVIKMEGDFFLSKMPVGGILLMHDTFPHHEHFLQADPYPHDVYKYRQDLERNPEVDVLSFPYPEITAGLTMVMKHTPNEDRLYWLKNGSIGEDIELNLINFSNNLHKKSPAGTIRMDKMKASMAKEGQLQAVKLTRKDDRYMIINGYHRVVSAIELGWKTIRAIIVDDQ